ncbi:MAG: signal peptidase I [Clostridia bacterium]|nr:signal peptidase I [Clostridia bacterium]
MNKKVKTIIRIVILTLIAALVGVSIYSINAARLNGNSLPMPLGFGLTVVLSGSMEPALSVGDMLVVAPQESYEVEDVVVFQTGRSAVVHRIISITKEGVITRGDANNTDDEPIALESIKGKVIIVIPFVGYIVNLIKTPIGTIILLGLAVWLLEGSFKKDKKQNDAELDAIRAEIERLKYEQSK